MDEFLGTTATTLKSSNYKGLTLVIGNESCDLDSAVSAIVFANFLSWQYNRIRCKVCTKGHRDENSPLKDDIFVPILNVDRKDYDLKTEVVYYFKSKGISESNLVFRDDYDFNDLVNKAKPKVVMVDHHALARRDKFLAPFVTEIVDHRPLDKSGWLYTDDVRSTLETTGSCCTLIAQRIKDLSELIAKEGDFFKDNPVCAEMLWATIILDTVNFSPDVDKATPHDEKMTLFLESLMGPGNHKDNRQSVNDDLIAARKNVASLTAAQLLKKDAKIVGDVYIPSFPILVKMASSAQLNIKYLDLTREVVDMWNVDSAIIVSIVVSAHDLISESLSQYLRRLSLGSWIKGLIQWAVLLDTEFLKRPEALQAVSEALQQNKCTVALLLGMDLTEGIQRDTALYSPDQPEKAKQLSKHLLSWTRVSLGLSPERLSTAEDCSYYWQLNLSASRKHYIPAVNTFTNT